MQELICKRELKTHENYRSQKYLVVFEPSVEWPQEAILFNIEKCILLRCDEKCKSNSQKLNYQIHSHVVTSPDRQIKVLIRLRFFSSLVEHSSCNSICLSRQLLLSFSKRRKSSQFLNHRSAAHVWVFPTRIFTRIFQRRSQMLYNRIRHTRTPLNTKKSINKKVYSSSERLDGKLFFL